MRCSALWRLRYFGPRLRSTQGRRAQALLLAILLSLWILGPLLKADFQIVHFAQLDDSKDTALCRAKQLGA
ncbi:hypothetical protein HPB47_011307 [Ixodes persulcatus]|uniref:Uncharacterized protein n=1 Tax=Ixodes persulcatus TaxID=34615 RepID=A0AC60NWN5_IXOPE|nr:hypothetical protein HPB47_011307 [Ixodes persulcatus]